MLIFTRPGENEQLIESKFLYEFGKRGGRFPAYTPIVAGGENACVLHYIENNQDRNESDLILVDAGCNQHQPVSNQIHFDLDYSQCNEEHMHFHHQQR